MGYLQAAEESTLLLSRKKSSWWSGSEYASDSLTQPPPPLFPRRLRAVSIFFRVTKVAGFCPYVLNDNKNSKDLIGKATYKPSIPPPRNKLIERALKFSLLLLWLFSRSTSTKWQRCVVFWRASSSHRKADQTGTWTRTSCTPSSVPHSSSHSFGVSVVIWSRLPWMHLTHLPGICSPTQTMLRWSSYNSNYKVLFIVCLFVCSLVLPRHWNNYNVLMV